MIDRRLKVRHIQAFVEIARYRSLKQAASRLNLTQPAISKTLKELEEISGVTLLTRSRSGVSLTPEGDIFLSHATNGLTALELAMTGASAFRKGEAGRVSVGALPSVAGRVLPLASQLFAAKAPASTLLVEDGPHGFLVDRLKDGKLDLVIGRLGKPETMKNLSFSQLYMENAVIVCAPDHPLAKAKSLADLEQAAVIYPPADSALRPLVDRMMLANGLAAFPNRVESVSPAFGRAIAISGQALWIISAGVAAADVEAGSLVSLPINFSITAGPIGIMTRAEHNPSQLAREFSSAAKEAILTLGLG